MLATDRTPTHARQFILGPRARKGAHDWVCLPIDDGSILSHCPRLRVGQVADRAGRRWSLLGLAVQSDPRRGSPEEELAAHGRGDIAPVHETWAGRWILIGERRLHLDAGGLLGCYYLKQDGLWLSSSLALLSEIGGREVRGSRRHAYVKGDGFGWDPLPRTCYDGIAKLMPTQGLDLASGEPLPRNPIPFPATAAAYDDLVDRMGESLTTTVRNLAGTGRRLWIALSAGYHSRVLLAAALKAGVAVKAYTQTFPMMLRADRDLPPRLAEAVGIEHVLHEPGVEDSALYERMDRHSHGLYDDADRTFYGKRQWAWIGQGDVALRGLGFELGQCFDWRLLPQRPLERPILAAFGGEQAPRYIKESLAEYLAWITRYPAAGMDWRDRWYLDMRMGGWVSEEEQVLDLIAGQSVVPANAARFYGLMLQVPAALRRDKRHFRDLMDRLWPGLADYPFNAPDTLTRDVLRRLHKYAVILRERGAWCASYQVSAALRRRLVRHRDLRQGATPVGPQPPDLGERHRSG